MIEGQAERTLSVESAETRARVPALGLVYSPPARVATPGADALLRSELPISPELGAFLTQQLSSARAHDLGAITTAGATTLATLLAAPEPWPAAYVLDLLQRVATLLDTADTVGLAVGTFTPCCVVLSGRHLVLARPDARAGLDLAYVAPEQLQPGARVDGRASQYGFAMVASRLLGVEPRARGYLGAIRRRPATPGGLSRTSARAVQRVILVARAPDPARRFRTTSEFVAALGAACGAWALAEFEPGVAVAPAPVSRGLALVGGMLGVAACAGAMGWYAARRPVVIPPELANDIATGRVVTDTSRRTPATDVVARAESDQYGYRLLMAAPPARDSAAREREAGATTNRYARVDTPPLPTFATAIALPRTELGGDANRRVTTSTEFAAAGVAQSLRRASTASEEPAARAPARVVDDGASVTRPTLVSGGEGPAYPVGLLATRTEGEVIARFVIDSTGRVDPGSILIVRSAHTAFTTAVRGALSQYRYRPAERGGRRISATVEQQFRFAVPTR